MFTCNSILAIFFKFDDPDLIEVTIGEAARYPVVIHGTTHECWSKIKTEVKLSFNQRKCECIGGLTGIFSV